MAAFSDDPPTGQYKLSLYAETRAGDPWPMFRHRLEEFLQHPVELDTRANHAILLAEIDPNAIKKWLRNTAPDIHLLAIGRHMTVYKDVGRPTEVSSRYALESLQGSHLVGHTRMATESAVTPERAHPFTAGTDFCLVHNGSLSNPYSVRRKLEAEGIEFATDNDTEAACRFLEWRLREGDSLEDAIEQSFSALDGFFTFLMGTAEQLALVRDPFACKPAVVAETSDYVAIASEFHALAHLPGIQHAHIFEPAPEEIYVWNV
ncbi:class II glutamine amidotransferase [Acidithiobacillus sp. AMEEHan]|uniref:class II glutamine amidotransferase n=1 Tax=Acidithiobacillus sp. AMEEHan TaxID=2994951 RepID=UPI0027E589BE|nr:class II glutamine amidotransferase [Acidithiobacillus sp. AMEEHan]